MKENLILGSVDIDGEMCLKIYKSHNQQVKMATDAYVGCLWSRASARPCCSPVTGPRS